jgi:NAD(P)-dependent dehydrogenase (short-subunit alcohol dehydrogenase family)
MPTRMRLIVAAEDGELALILERRLSGDGAVVALVGPRPLHLGAGRGGSIAAHLADPVAVRAAFSRAAGDLGGVDAVVAAVLDGQPGTPIAESDPAAWQGEAELPLLRCGAVTAAAKAVLGGAGALVYLVSAAACRGVSPTTAHGTASEGVRGLAKSAARIWGPGLRVNMVAADPPWDDEPGSTEAPAGDVFDVIMALASSPALSGLRGATMFVDGGQAMVT